MATTVLMFANRVSGQPGWTNAELAELYRVEHALVQARINIETDRGVTDEGDPWFVFCRPGGDVVVHATRFGGIYRLYSPALPQPLTGVSFAALTKSFVSGLRTPVETSKSVSIHPAALLSVLIAAIFYSVDFHSGSAQAAETIRDHQKKAAESTHAPPEAASADTLFHTFVTSIKALLEPAAEAASHPFAFLASLEATAVAAVAIALSGLAEFANNSDSNSELVTTKAAADDQQCVLDCQNGAAPQHQLNEKSNWQTANDATNQAVITASLQGDSQSGQDAKHILPVVAERSDMVAADAKALASTTNSNTALSADSQAAINGAALVAIGDGSVVVAENHIGLPTTGLHSNDGGTTANITLSNDDVAALSSSDSIQAVDIVLVQGGGSIDLSNAAGVDKITVAGDGDLQISGITSSENPQLVVASGSAEILSLSFGAVATASFAIRLDGQDQLLLAGLSTHGTSVQLTLDSEGAAANNVTIADTAVVGASTLALKAIGVEDLILNESAAVFSITNVDTSGLTGALTISLDLGNTFESVNLSQVNAANFIVADDANVAFLQAANGSHIQLGSNLNIVDFSVASATAAAPGALALSLQTEAGQASALVIHELNVYYVSNLAIDSSGTGSGYGKTIETLTDSSLSILTITGDSALTVGSIQGVASSDSQSVIINASALTGSLNINASDIADTATLGRSITIIGGSGNNVLTNMTISEATTFVSGAGSTVINIGVGATNDSIVAVNTIGTVNIGSATHNDAVVNELNAGTDQGLINSQGNLTAAAHVASTLAGSTAAQQAVLFSYQGNTYVFVDATGSHLFNASQDAIIKIAGLSASMDLTNVFHSA
jgi:hypothetical protein